MELNLKYYKGENKKNTEKEMEIVNYISCQSNYDELLERDTSLDTIKALSEIRENILNWYPFKQDTSVLEINGNFGEITGMLSDRMKRVVTIERNIDKAKAIANRFKSRDNIEVIAGDWKSIDNNEKFDYIILLGIENETINLEEILTYLYNKLNINGMIIFSVENRLGLNSLNGVENIDFNGLQSKKNQLTKREIEDVIMNLEWNPHYKFYYPLPNYELPNVIFTDSYLPNEEIIERNLTLYDNCRLINFDENFVYKQIIKEDKNLFPKFSNSFLITLSSNTVTNKISMITFGNYRKLEYRLKTIVYENHVRKEWMSNKAKKHYEDIKQNIKALNSSNLNTLDYVEKEIIYSRLVKDTDSYDTFLIKIFKNNGIKELLKYIKLFENELKSKLKKSDTNCINIFRKYNIECADIEKLYLVEYGLYDLIFQNTFYINGEFFFYDQEWQERNVPIEFMLYRAIINLKKLKMEIDVEYLWAELGLKSYVKVFDDLENILQKKIRDDIIYYKIHMQNRTTIKNFYDEQIHLRNVQAQKTNDLIKEYENKEKELTEIKNSNSWKITKPLRNVRDIFR